MPKKFLTVKEIASLFGVTPLTVRNWDKKGRLSAYRNPLNNYRVYKTEDVEELLKFLDHKPQIKNQTVLEDKTPKKIKIEIG